MLAKLATKVYQASNQGYVMAFVLLMHPSTTVLLHNIGEVQTYHWVTKISPRIGMAPTPWDDVVFSFSGNMQREQALTSVAVNKCTVVSEKKPTTTTSKDVKKQYQT
jgi:hypothetical protein